MKELREQMTMDMQLRGFSPYTQKSYLCSIEKFSRHFNKSLDQLSTIDIRNYLYEVLANNQISDSYVRLIYSALRFLYETTLDRAWDIKKLPRSKTPKKLPILLAPSEISDLFLAASNPKHRALLMTIYGAGLRAGEAAMLRLTDIDSRNMTIRVQQGKGRKDRYTLLSPYNLDVLRNYWKLCRPMPWLFQGEEIGKPITARAVGLIFQQAKKKAGIRKPVSTHTLRHCFATHLLEQGTSVIHIQHLLGHTNLKTTSLYIHLTRKHALEIQSPLDRLENLPYA